MNYKNLDDILNKFPELNWIVNAAYKNSLNSGSGRKHGELTKKELYSYTKCLLDELGKNNHPKNKYCITVNDKPMQNTDGIVYEFDTPMEAIKMIDICYSLSSLKDGVEVGMLAGTEINLNVGDMDSFIKSLK